MSSLAPKILSALRLHDDLEQCVRTVMGCMQRSDSYVNMYVDILERSSDVPGMRDAVDRVATGFLETQPFMMPVAPTPEIDYDGFCDAVKDKRRRINMTEAIAKLGYAAMIAELVPLAMTVASEPAQDHEKDVAIAFIGTASRHFPGSQEGIRVWASTVLSDPDACGLGARNRFALMDLHDSLSSRSPHASRDESTS